MNLGKKKNLAARTLGAGKERIIFVKSRLDEIKEAITKQDIRELYRDGAIILRDIHGRKRVIKKKRNRSTGNIKKKAYKRKKQYVIMTRKLRGFVSELKRQKKLSAEEIEDIRKKIRNKFFKNKAGLREYVGGLRK